MEEASSIHQLQITLKFGEQWEKMCPCRRLKLCGMLDQKTRQMIFDKLLDKTTFNGFLSL